MFARFEMFSRSSEMVFHVKSLAGLYFRPLLIPVVRCSIILILDSVSARFSQTIWPRKMDRCWRPRWPNLEPPRIARKRKSKRRTFFSEPKRGLVRSRNRAANQNDS